MKFLLVGPECEENLSLGYLVSSLNHAGHSSKIVQFSYPEDKELVLQAASDADIIGLSLSFQVRAREFLQLSRELKTLFPEKPIIAGGHFASCAAENLLRDYREIDLIVIHEGEQTIVELADAWTCIKDRLDDIRGIVYRKGGEIYFSPPRMKCDDLDSLHFPWRSGPIHLPVGVPTAYILGSRGCLSSCDYCCITTLHRLAPGRTFRQRTPENIADEMSMLYFDKGIRQFVFHDDNFLVPSLEKNRKRLLDLRQALDNRGVTDFSFTIKCRPSDADYSIFQLMKSMGLIRVFFGIESGCDEGLASIGRHQTVNDSLKALNICRSLEISTQYTIMIFNPDATIKTIKKDLSFMRANINYPLNIVRAELYAGTPLEKKMMDLSRAHGSYIARQYKLLEPEAESVCSISRRIFYRRCWGRNNLMNRTIRLNHLVELSKKYYPEVVSSVLIDEVQSWMEEVNGNTLDLLEELTDLCMDAMTLGDRLFQNRLLKLISREILSRAILSTRGDNLQRRIEDLSLEQIGLTRINSKVIRKSRFSTNLAKHSAAALLAVSLAGTSLEVWANDPAPPPLEEDYDGDGLCDASEIEIFSTQRYKSDSDGDGIRDDMEDHNNDGVPNIIEFHEMISLMRAVESGNNEIVKSLYYKYGSYIHILHESSYSPLMIAIACNHLEIVQTLLELGADINDHKYGRDSLIIAAITGNIEMVTLILNSGYKLDESKDKTEALNNASYYGYTEIIKMLIDVGIDVNSMSSLGVTPLMRAVDSERLDTVKILLEIGAMPDLGNYNTPLILAVDKGNQKIVQMLLDAGADPDIQTSLGTSALIQALTDSPISMEIGQILLDSGADPDITGGEYEMTVLMMAVFGGNKNIIKFLLDSGANPYRADKIGRTAFTVAEDEANLEIIKLLQDYAD